MAEGIISAALDRGHLALLNHRLTRIASKCRHAKPLFRRIGVEMKGAYQRNMTSGLDPNGKPLARVAVWTRAAGVGAGAGRDLSKITPLVNTGTLRRSLGIKELTDRKMRFGFAGKGEKRAEDQQFGRPGFMRVRKKRVENLYSGILTADDGHDFCRVNTADGWRTKQVTEGSFIRIKPRARRFFYLGLTQARKAVRIAQEYVQEAVHGNA